MTGSVSRLVRTGGETGPAVSGRRQRGFRANSLENRTGNVFEASARELWPRPQNRESRNPGPRRRVPRGAPAVFSGGEEG